MNLRIRPTAKDVGFLQDYMSHWRPRSQRSWVRNSFACFGFGVMAGTFVCFFLIWLFADLKPTLAEAKTNLEQARKSTYEQAVKDLQRWDIERRTSERQDGSKQ